MSFVIKYLPDGMYVYSQDVKVYEKVFGRRFSSVKQAKAFLRTTYLRLEDCCICELTDAEVSQIENEYKLLTENDASHL